MQHMVSFGSFRATDAFGYIGRAVMTVDAEAVEFYGKRLWSPYARIGFLILSLAVTVPFIGILGIIGSFVIAHFACASKAKARIPRATITGLKRNGAGVVFEGEETPAGKKQKIGSSGSLVGGFHWVKGDISSFPR